MVYFLFAIIILVGVAFIGYEWTHRNNPRVSIMKKKSEYENTELGKIYNDIYPSNDQLSTQNVSIVDSFIERIRSVIIIRNRGSVMNEQEKELERYLNLSKKRLEFLEVELKTRRSMAELGRVDKQNELEMLKIEAEIHELRMKIRSFGTEKKEDDDPYSKMRDKKKKEVFEKVVEFFLRFETRNAIIDEWKRIRESILKGKNYSECTKEEQAQIDDLDDAKEEALKAL